MPIPRLCLRLPAARLGACGSVLAISWHACAECFVHAGGALQRRPIRPPARDAFPTRASGRRYGLRGAVRRLCDGLVAVEAAPGRELGGLDSLNVSVATGILLHSMLLSGRTPVAAAVEA